MAIYYLIRGDQIIATIETDATDVIAIPLLGGGDSMSLLNKDHADNLQANLGLSAVEAAAALGISDLTGSMLTTVVIGPDPRSLGVAITARRLPPVGPYHLWAVMGQQDDLLEMHSIMWDRSPVESLGLLAVVQTPGETFHGGAVRAATGMTVPQALARRDRIATCLEGLGHINTGDLRASTTEHDQMIGIATALGFTEVQLWASIS